MIALCVAVYAAIEWTGFALTGDMSKSTVDQLLEKASIGYASEARDSDGTVHYYDQQGNETLVLSAEDAAQYELQLEEEREAAVREETELVDVDTLEIVPQSITELEIVMNGRIPDYVLGNGHMLVFCDEGKNGYLLAEGDKLTLTLESGDECRVAYYLIRDRRVAEQQIDASLCMSHHCDFQIQESGSYCIAVMYASASASSFTQGMLLIDKN